MIRQQVKKKVRGKQGKRPETHSVKEAGEDDRGRDAMTTGIKKKKKKQVRKRGKETRNRLCKEAAEEDKER